MNTYQDNNNNNNSAYLFFSNEDEIRQIEDAVRTAISNVIKVFCNINNNKMHEYELKVAERDKENGILRVQLDTAERELLSLRKLKALKEHRNAEGPDRHSNCDPSAGLCVEGKCRQRLCLKSQCSSVDDGVQCEAALKGEFASACGGTMAWDSVPARDVVTLGTGACVPEHEDQQSHTDGPALIPLSESDTQLDDTPQLPASPLSSLEIKEEPLNFETVYIKWEVSEERMRMEEDILGKERDSQLRPEACGPLSRGRGAQHRVLGVPGVSYVQSALLGDMSDLARQQKRLSNRERQQRYREKIRADPERQRAYREKDRCRYQKRRKLICELPEQTQRLKRQAWREAARRHRARKKSCLQLCQLPCLGNMEATLSAVAHLRS